jgi:hypothetical protein
LLEIEERFAPGKPPANFRHDPAITLKQAYITLTNLHSEKDLLEREAAALRQSLHELHQGGREHTLTAHVWQAEFARLHEKLVIVAGKIGELDKRILALVEGEEGSDPKNAPRLRV